MKNVRYLSMVLAMLVISVCLAGCSKDDSDNNVVSEENILGTWIDTGGEVTFQFKNDGTGVTTTKAGTNNFNYTYSASEKKLKLWYVNSGTVDNFSVQRTGNTLMLTQGNTTLVLTKK